MMKSNTPQSNMTILDMVGQLEKRLEAAQKENQVLQKKIKKRETIILQQQRQIKHLKQDEVIDVASAILPLEMMGNSETTSPAKGAPTFMDNEVLSFAEISSAEPLPLQTNEILSAEQIPSETFQENGIETAQFDSIVPESGIPPKAESHSKTALDLGKRYTQTKALLGKVFGEISFTSPKRRNQFAHLSKQFS